MTTGEGRRTDCRKHRRRQGRDGTVHVGGGDTLTPYEQRKRKSKMEQRGWDRGHENEG